MNILWDKAKNKKLRENRGFSFEEIVPIILDKKYLAVLENPARNGQLIFVISYKNYTYVVPFIIDSKDNIILKTIFPSRKFHKIFEKKKK